MEKIDCLLDVFEAISMALIIKFAFISVFLETILFCSKRVKISFKLLECIEIEL